MPNLGHLVFGNPGQPAEFPGRPARSGILRQHSDGPRRRPSLCDHPSRPRCPGRVTGWPCGPAWARRRVCSGRGGVAAVDSESDSESVWRLGLGAALAARARSARCHGDDTTSERQPGVVEKIMRVCRRIPELLPGRSLPVTVRLGDVTRSGSLVTGTGRARALLLSLQHLQFC